MQRGVNIQFCCRLERPPHFLDTQQQRKAGIKSARNSRFTPPVFACEDCRCPLPGTEAVKGFTAIIAQLLTPGVNAAAEVTSEVLAGFAGELVMPELAAALKRKRRAAERKAFAAVGGKVGFHFSWSFRATACYGFVFCV